MRGRTARARGKSGGGSAKVSSAAEEPAGSNSPVKRTYNRKSLLCRLCLRTLGKEELPEIFAADSSIQKAIRTAVSVEVSRKDSTIRICQCCLDLVHLINNFRTVCERTEHLLSQNVEVAEGSFWTNESDQKTFGKCRILVEECKTAVEKLFQEQSLVYCKVETNDLLDESKNEEEEEEANDDIKPASEHGEEDAIEQFEPKVLIDDHEFVKDEVESDPGGFSDAASDDDPDYVEESTKIVKAEDTEKDEDEDPPPKKRRGRPRLPEEQLKRKRHVKGEPRKKGGPRKRRAKLPSQSVCEICGLLVNRENEERHRNDHLGQRPYVCTMEGCDHAFSSKAGLHGHIARHADRNNVYDCDICGAKIKSKSSFHRHRKMHTMEKPHACAICGKRFWRRSYLNHHSTVHTGIAKFPCEFCGFVFKNKYWRTFHVKQKHLAKGEVPKYEAQDELDENGTMPLGPPELGEEEYVADA